MLKREQTKRHAIGIIWHQGGDNSRLIYRKTLLSGWNIHADTVSHSITFCTLSSPISQVITPIEHLHVCASNWRDLPHETTTTGLFCFSLDEKSSVHCERDRVNPHKLTLICNMLGKLRQLLLRRGDFLATSNGPTWSRMITWCYGERNPRDIRKTLSFQFYQT